MDSLTFLERGAKAKLQPIYVVHGDEHFLKRQVLKALQRLALGPDENGFGASVFPGDKAVFATVHDELETLPFLSSRRLVIIDAAEPFVKRERERLERYFARPSASGVLVLELPSWPSNTRLAKALPDAGVISCKAPSAQKLPPWCREWATRQHGKELAPAAAQLLVDLVGTDMGLLEQELGKLAVYAGQASRIESGDVDKLVGQSRSENTWKIFDLIGAGQAGQALELLHRLLEQGEDPMRLLGAFSMQLRRLAQAGRLAGQGAPMATALEQAGVPPFGRQAGEQQLRHLGRRRADRLYDWLLEVDLGMKGSSQLPPRTLLERLVIQLARPSSFSREP